MLIKWINVKRLTTSYIDRGVEHKLTAYRGVD